MNWYWIVLKKYAVFEGRARRKEFWCFQLFSLIIYIGLMLIDHQIIGIYSQEYGIGILGGIYTLAVLLPNLTVTVRRLHDIGRTGWWALFFFTIHLNSFSILMELPAVVFLIVNLVLLILACTVAVFMFFKSVPEENKYGPSPLAL